MFTSVKYNLFTFVTKFNTINMQFQKLYKTYREKSLQGRWIHYLNISSILDELNEFPFTNKVLGYSFNKVPIHSIKIGTGKTKILLWTQMHGDESTATNSIFDIFNFIKAEYKTNTELISLLKTCTLVFIPMLNPDGALAYTRFNAQGIDLNRDAVNLEASESQVLHNMINAFKPDYAFNLHDQMNYYSVTGSDKCATLSFLAPAEEETRQVTENRKKAMSVIVAMNTAIQTELPNKVGRYNDAFCDNCFGDYIQTKAPTILIESGHYPHDFDRNRTRFFHFKSLLTGLFAISNKELPDYKEYDAIPQNKRNVYDLRIDNVLYDDELTTVSVRFDYKLEANKLVAFVDIEELYVGNDIENNLYCKIVDGKAAFFKEIIKNHL